MGTVALGLAGAATGTVSLPIVAIGAIAVVSAAALTIAAKAAGAATEPFPELKAMSDATKKFLDDFGDAAKIVTDVMTDPDFRDAFANKGAEIFTSMLDAIGNVLIPPAYGSDINPLVANQFNAASAWRQPVYDPLTVDLDGDGIETVGIAGTNTVLFDHNGDGLKQGTSWVKGDDGLLAWDRSGNGTIDNGSELFGIDFVKSNGQKATDGFDALRDLDSNGDGQFNADDAQFAAVRVWRDLNQDGISQANELQSLAEVGIASIGLNAATTTTNLGNGNTLSHSAGFTRTDGSTGTAANLNFATDVFHRRFTNTVDTSAVANLPDMQGSGAVRDLRETANDSRWRIAA